MSTLASPVQRRTEWAKLIDHGTCIGCHACSTACKSENDVPVSVNRTYVKYVDVGAFPSTRRAFQVTRCNQCADAPCVTACPTSAMHHCDNGIVDFDKSWCIGCKACIAACPYDAIFINPADGSAEKCNLCAHRLEVGLEPACVVVCPTQSIAVGNLHDSASRVAQAARNATSAVRRPEMGTRPKVFYAAASAATLDPLAATRPDGGLFMWSEQFKGPRAVAAGRPGSAEEAVDALLSYDVPHRAPWDWRVSLYTWTKSIAAGAYLVPAAGVWAGRLDETNPLWTFMTPLVALVFLCLTGVLLIADLTHPERFYYLFLRGQRQSWLVKGAYILAAYGALLLLHAWVGMVEPAWLGPLAIPGVALAAATAVYTSALFKQAKARELWNSPLLAPHLLAQANLAGASVIWICGSIAGLVSDPIESDLARLTLLSALVHLALVGAELRGRHTTAHRAHAMRNLTVGAYSRVFVAGLLLSLPALGAPWLGPVSALLALGALMAYEHAYVQAGQSVPLA